MAFLRRNWISMMCIAMILAFFIAFTIINFFGFEQFCTADMYSDTYLSRLMWEEKTIFPESWVFGNQFYVCVTPVVAALFYGLCGSINLAMALATTAMTALILVSFWWMLRPFATREQILLGMAVLTGCVIGPRIETTIEGQIFYIMASYYAGYLITLFVVFGDYVRVLHGKKAGWLSLGTAVVLSFCTGMQSLRQTAVMVLPILVFEGLRLLMRLRRREPGWWRKPSTLRAAAYTLANLLGMVAIRVLDPNCITMYGKLTFNPVSRMPECVSTGLRALRSITGLKYLSSELPVLGVVAVLLVLTAIAALLMAAFDRKRSGVSSLLLLCGCSVVCVIGVSILINIYTRSIYVFPWYAAAAVSAMVVFERWRDWRRGIVAAVLTAALFCNLMGSYAPTVEEALEDPEPPQREIAQYLMDEGYTRLYGDWMSIASIAVWTDGEVAAGSWINEVCSILEYINPMDIYSEDDNANAAYLVRTGEEEAFLARAGQMGAQVELLVRFEGTVYALYTSDTQLMFHAAH